MLIAKTNEILLFSPFCFSSIILAAISFHFDYCALLLTTIAKHDTGTLFLSHTNSYIHKFQMDVVAQYEPVFESERSRDFLQHIILYECQGTSPHLEALSRENGRPCSAKNNPNIPCNAIVAAWFKGSEVRLFCFFFTFSYSRPFLLGASIIQH